MEMTMPADAAKKSPVCLVIGAGDATGSAIDMNPILRCVVPEHPISSAALPSLTGGPGNGSAHGVTNDPAAR